MQTPLREFLATETGSAAVLLAATIVALVWVNLDESSYSSLWTTELSIAVGGHGISLDLREWVNSGLMTFFFFVVGLEARREFDLGELRERRRVALPVLAGLGGMVVPVAIYLAINAGRASAHGWGAAMSTDTAFALGVLALVGPRFPTRLRAFMLTRRDRRRHRRAGRDRDRLHRATSTLVALAVARRPLRRDRSCCATRACASASLYALLGVGAWVAL